MKLSSLPATYWVRHVSNRVRCHRPPKVFSTAGHLVQEIIQHPQGLPGASVCISVEIEATAPDGVPDDVVRIANENSQSLNIKTFTFEE